MPRINSAGSILGGAGNVVTIDGVVYASAGTSASWLNDSTIICQCADDAWRVSICRVGEPGAWQAYWPQGCNYLTAGGGLWQCHLVDVDCYGEYGSKPGMGLGLLDGDGRGYAGPNGEINIVPLDGLGIQIHSRSHGVYAIPFGAARDVQVLGPTSALWRDDAWQFHAHGIPVPAQASPGGSPRYCVLADGTPWVVYASTAYGLIAHPAQDASQGVVLAPPGTNAFYPDARVVGGTIVACWSSGAAELAHEIVVVRDVLALPRVPFATTAPPVTVTPITTPCWAGFFVGGPTSPDHWKTSDDPAACPGNSYLLIEEDVDGAQVKRDSGEVVGDYLTGSVEQIEQAAARTATQGRIAFCYYDAPAWPRLPQLPASAIVLHQAYQFVGESAATFESRLGQQLQWFASYPSGLCAQCFTSNTGLTPDLASVVASVGRLAQSYPLVAVMGFSGTGRATGLQDHPEVRPLWEALFASVPCTPDASAPPQPQPPNPEPGPTPEPPRPATPPPDNGLDANGVCVNPAHYFASLTWDKPPAEFERVFRDIEDALWLYGFGFQCRSDGTPSSRLYLPTAICPSAGAVTPQDEHLGVKQDPHCWSDEYPWAGADTIENNAAGQPIGWTWQPRGSGVYQPVAAPTAPHPPEPQPPTLPTGLGYLRTEFGDHIKAKRKTGELHRGDAQLLTLTDEGEGRVSIRIGGSGKYVCADPGLVDDPLYANRDSVGPWERFFVERRDDGQWRFTAESTGLYVCAEDTGKVVCNRATAGGWESFTFEAD